VVTLALPKSRPSSLVLSAEYQKRGVVNFHAIIRIDGPDGPSTPPPSWATAALLADAITEAATSVQVKTPPPPLSDRAIAPRS